VKLMWMAVGVPRAVDGPLTSGSKSGADDIAACPPTTTDEKAIPEGMPATTATDDVQE
jgi:hypothetical protein